MLGRRFQPYSLVAYKRKNQFNASERGKNHCYLGACAWGLRHNPSELLFYATRQIEIHNEDQIS
jgi:hypothetical protein